MDEIAAWVRKQANADLAAAGEATPGPWEFEGDDPTDDELYSTHDDNLLPTVAWTRDRQVANGRHMERHDPRTEIARAESAVAILREHAPVEITEHWTVCYRCTDWTAGTYYGTEDDDEDPVNQSRMSWPCNTVRLLAFGYRYREGWQETWKP